MPGRQSSSFCQIKVSLTSEMVSSNVSQNSTKAVIKNSNSDKFNQFIVGMSNPKDSLTIAAESNTVSNDCQDNLILTSTSILAKDIIENYKYDFSETFIDILFFERIDLARTRTI